MIKFDNTLFANGPTPASIDPLELVGIQAISDSGNVTDNGTETEVESLDTSSSLDDVTLDQIQELIEEAINNSLGNIDFEQLLAQIEELLGNVGINDEDITAITKSVVESLQEITIVGLKERIVLGPCDTPETESPKAKKQTEKQVPQALPRSLKNVPKMIKKPPLLDDEN